MNTRIVKNPSNSDYADAANCLKRGGLVAFPTETVYGLGANGLDSDAVKKIYMAKGRPSDNPLILHLFSAQEAEKYCQTSPLYYKLAMAFMPGPLTVIMKKKEIVPDAVTGGLCTVAVRVPAHPVARKLLEISGVPIAAPSANISGKPSPTKLSHVLQDMDGKIDMIFDGGECTVGVESTVVKIDGEDLCILRPGAVTGEMLTPFCANLHFDPCLEHPVSDGLCPLAPGMKYKHYAPRANVVLLDGNKERILSFLKNQTEKREVGILCGEEMCQTLACPRALSLGNDPEEEARRLFSCLRDFDEKPEIQVIYAPLPSKTGIEFAVYNRLIKAAGFTVLSL